MKTGARILILLICLDFCQCKKVIQVNLNNAAPQLIIIGEVTNGPGPYQVNLSQSVNFSADNVFPPVSGAFISITDSGSSLTDTLVENPAGTYSTRFLKGLPNHIYRLSVSVNNQNYSAISTMPLPVLLDSLTFIQSEGFRDRTINPMVNFQDPAGVANYYQFTEAVKGRPIDKIFILDDRLSDGKYIRQPLFNDSMYIQPGDIVSIGMLCIEKKIYDYFNALQNATGNGFQSVAPANPNTNISNGALGYFSAHTIQNVEALAN
jgi:hypothetical protein